MKILSKIKLLLDVAQNMRSLADSLHAMADAMDSGEPNQPVQPVEPKPEVKEVKLEQVRAVLAEKSQDGFTAEVRGLLEKYGASKLSQIDPANYAALMADAEGLK